MTLHTTIWSPKLSSIFNELNAISAKPNMHLSIVLITCNPNLFCVNWVIFCLLLWYAFIWIAAMNTRCHFWCTWSTIFFILYQQQFLVPTWCIYLNLLAFLAQVCWCPPSLYTRLFFLPKFSSSPLFWIANTRASLSFFPFSSKSDVETTLLHVSFMCVSLSPNIFYSNVLYSQGIIFFTHISTLECPYLVFIFPFEV